MANHIRYSSSSPLAMTLKQAQVLWLIPWLCSVRI